MINKISSLAIVVIFLIAIKSPALFGAEALYHWSFDEGAGTMVKDNGPQQCHGKLRKAKSGDDIPLWVDGKFGKGLKFDGANYVQLEKPFPVFDRITVMAWIKTEKVRVRGTIIGNKGDIANDGFRFEYTPWWGRLAFQYGDGSKTQGIITNPNAVKPDFWTHVAASYDGKFIRLYQNGIKIIEQEADGAIEKHAGAPRIGMYLNSDVYGFSGIIDDVKIYADALDGEEIMAIIIADNNKSTGADEK